MPFRILIALIWLIAPLLAVAEQQVATFVIRSQPAAAVVDTVRPLLDKDGGVSAFHDKLIVRGTARQIADVKALLAQIDRPARRLLIEVRQSGRTSAAHSETGYGVSSDHVQLGQPPRGDGAQVYYRGVQTRSQDDGVQRVQALDGYPALIRSGQAVPVYQAHQQVIGNQIVQGFDLRYRDVQSGFFALPRVHGDEVTVEIYQQRERVAGDGRFDSQHASTILRGGLGAWLPLGGIGGSDDDSRNAFGRHVQTRRSEDRQIDLRVIAVD
ncbi:MAG: hypothetical protein KDJ27_06775 [Gammaproteobacteria bacterium]|nr:hypothetical protein [Gammaproteobacteria bacterium]MCB1923443.1 hypothetical protein [Gammaproteobacteria bacterium]